MTSKRDSTGVIFSPASGVSSPSQVAGTTITLISNGRVISVNPAIVAADCPTVSPRNRLVAGSTASARNVSDSSGVSTAAPWLSSWATKSARTDRSTTRLCSAPQMTPLSNDLDITIELAAVARSASGAIQHGALPGPTPSAGVPEL